jgi:2-dehydro-3-deoxyphosphogluconate aldolase/(4S)-4-hydroxy-2-oxoglutarate aldolase
MMIKKTLDIINNNKIIAVIRLSSPEKVSKIIKALAAGGIKCLEITLTIPNALEVIKEVAGEVPPDFVIGAGTVLDPVTARLAILAGADFIVAPNTNPDVIQMCKTYSIPVIAGGFTPNEVLNAWTLGADIIKIFPARAVGPKFFRDLKGPYPYLKMMPTGGVLIDNAADYIRAGACAVSIGNDVLDKDAIKEDNFNIITEKARKLVGNISNLVTN